MAPIDALCDFVEEDPQLLKAMFILNFEAGQDSGVLRERIQRWLTAFRANLDHAVRQG